MKNYQKILELWVWTHRDSLEIYARENGLRCINDKNRSLEREDYFLISSDNTNNIFDYQCTLIMIGGKIWQYRYCSPKLEDYISCSRFIEDLKKGLK